MNTTNNPSLATQARRPWVPPTVKTVGTISAVLQAGGGKVSQSGGDGGDSRKESGTI